MPHIMTKRLQKTSKRQENFFTYTSQHRDTRILRSNRPDKVVIAAHPVYYVEVNWKDVQTKFLTRDKLRRVGKKKLSGPGGTAEGKPSNSDETMPDKGTDPPSNSGETISDRGHDSRETSQDEVNFDSEDSDGESSEEEGFQAGEIR